MEYKKKPIVIRAFRFGVDPLPSWAVMARKEGRLNFYQSSRAKWAEIETLEGTMRADEGTYIIQGVAGELYPCQADIFEMTYERVIR